MKQSESRYLKSIDNNLCLTKDYSISQIQKKLASKSYKTNHSKPTLAWPDPDKSNSPLLPGHAYTILGTYKDEKGDLFVTLRNPWGNTEENEEVVSGDDVLLNQLCKPIEKTSSKSFFSITAESFKKFFVSWGEVK